MAHSASPESTAVQKCGFRKFWRADSGNSGHQRRRGCSGRIVKAEVFGAAGAPVEREQPAALEDGIHDGVRECQQHRRSGQNQRRRSGHFRLDRAAFVETALV